MSAHPHLWHHDHAGTPWMQSIAGTAIVILFSFGLYRAAEQWKDGRIPEGLLSVGTFIGPALVYAFGFFWCLPEVWGTGSPEQRHTLRQRWVDFSLLCVFFALAVIAAVYLWAIYSEYSSIMLVGAFVVIISWTWVLSACVVASAQCLDPAASEAVLPGGAGWRRWARRVSGTWGTWLVKLLRTRGSLLLGAALVFLSLALVFDGGIFSPDFTGYNVLTGKASTWLGVVFYPGWPITRGLGLPVLTQVNRLVYGMGLLVALVGLLALVRDSRKWPWKLSQAGLILAALIALFQLTEVSFLSGLDDASRISLALAAIAWSIPLVVWFAAAGRDRERRSEIRAAIFVFYLPIFMIGSAWLIVFSYLAPGFGTFVMGMLLLWWGLLQQQREVASRWPELVEPARRC